MSGQDPLALAEWQRIRRYAVPEWMITECTAARERGDWRAACEAGGIDVDIDDPAPFAGQLAGLAPDLLRWHLPRALGGYTTIAEDRQYALIPHDGAVEPDSTVLVVDSPVSLLGSQRLTLTAVSWFDLPDETVPLPAYLWDARHAGELRTAVSGTDARLPGFAPDGTPLPGELLGTGDDPPARAERVRREDDLAARFTAAGIEVAADFGVEMPRWGNGGDIRVVDPLRLAHDARTLAARFDIREMVLWIDYYLHVLVQVDRETVRAEWRIHQPGDTRNSLHRLDSALARYPADLDLIRAGRLTAGQLHPLVRAALFPGVPAAAAPPEPVPGPIRVRCEGEWHEVEVRQGRLTLPAHSAEQRRREQALRAFGGAVTGCFATEQTWSGTNGRLPKRLRAHREHLWQRIVHGGTRTLLELLDDGLDPHLRDSRGRTLMHRLRSFDHTVLLPRLLAAGVDVNARDFEGSTPLYLAVVHQVPSGVITGLVDAGADVNVPNQDDLSVMDYLDEILVYRDELDADFEAAVAYIRKRG
ncbi:MAG TPA: hypothetical protein VN408_42090 [Actinoplanes sp.]|nr:hypothetical protein [Actinoplanes sp.]